MILLRTTARHLFPTHPGTYTDNIPRAHSAANIITQRKLGGAEVSKPQLYLLGIPRHVLKWQWARLPGQRRPAGQKQEVCIPDTGGALCDQYYYMVTVLLVHLVGDQWDWRVPRAVRGVGRALPGLNTNIITLQTCTVRSRYKRQLTRLNMKERLPIRTGMEDSRPIIFCKRFSYNKNALYQPLRRWTIPTINRDTDPYRSNVPIYEPYGHRA